jgi:hypothetical protein
VEEGITVEESQRRDLAAYREKQREEGRQEAAGGRHHCGGIAATKICCFPKRAQMRATLEACVRRAPFKPFKISVRGGTDGSGHVFLPAPLPDLVIAFSADGSYRLGLCLAFFLRNCITRPTGCRSGPIPFEWSLAVLRRQGQALVRRKGPYPFLGLTCLRALAAATVSKNYFGICSRPPPIPSREARLRPGRLKGRNLPVGLLNLRLLSLLYCCVLVHSQPI